MTIPSGRGADKWRRCGAKSPCPICKGDWCSVTADGAVAKCMRVAEGTFMTKTDKNGAEYYLHRLNGATGASAAPPPPSGPGPERAGADALHSIYSALLALLALSKVHRERLQRRGLPDAEIDHRLYRTLPIQGRARVARELRERFGDALLSVPGFIAKVGDSGRPYVTIAGAAGLLVPVRDAAGRIVALLVRRDDAGDGGKYSYLSSAKVGGPGPGSPPHVPLAPLGVTPCWRTCRLTEGALKADIAYALSGLPTIGAAGLAWGPALDVARLLHCDAVRLAFDADALDNQRVARAMYDCGGRLDEVAMILELERWDRADGKGIDDLFAAGKTPEVLAGEEARAAIREILAAATAGDPPTEPGPLERLADVLADGGAEALFRDRAAAAGAGPTRRERSGRVRLSPRPASARRRQAARPGQGTGPAPPRTAPRPPGPRRRGLLPHQRRPDRPRRAD